MITPQVVTGPRSAAEPSPLSPAAHSALAARMLSGEIPNIRGLESLAFVPTGDQIRAFRDSENVVPIPFDGRHSWTIRSRFSEYTLLIRTRDEVRAVNGVLTAKAETIQAKFTSGEYTTTNKGVADFLYNHKDRGMGAADGKDFWWVEDDKRQKATQSVESFLKAIEDNPEVKKLILERVTPADRLLIETALGASVLPDVERHALPELMEEPAAPAKKKAAAGGKPKAKMKLKAKHSATLDDLMKG